MRDLAQDRSADARLAALRGATSSVSHMDQYDIARLYREQREDALRIATMIGRQHDKETAR